MDVTATSAISANCQLFDLERVASLVRADILDAARCEDLVLELLHQGASCCPACGDPLQGKKRATFLTFGRVQCSACGKWFSATTGTPLHKVKLDPRQLIMIAYLLSLGVDTARIAAAAGVDQETVRIWRLKFQALGNQELATR